RLLGATWLSSTARECRAAGLRWTWRGRRPSGYSLWGFQVTLSLDRTVQDGHSQEPRGAPLVPREHLQVGPSPKGSRMVALQRLPLLVETQRPTSPTTRPSVTSASSPHSAHTLPSPAPLPWPAPCWPVQAGGQHGAFPAPALLCTPFAPLTSQRSQQDRGSSVHSAQAHPAGVRGQEHDGLLQAVAATRLVAVLRGPAPKKEVGEQMLDVLHKNSSNMTRAEDSHRLHGHPHGPPGTGQVQLGAALPWFPEGPSCTGVVGEGGVRGGGAHRG
ncbi:LOW QUALITY PROTEIN: hypothetical protein J0S82_016838, partial [Galemys pyrenaicus]